MPLNLGNVEPHVAAAADTIERVFGGNLIIGGWRATGSVADSDHPKGLALDVMTTSASLGNRIAEWAITNAGPLSINYIIWNRRIWQNGTWKPYSGPSPHTDHVHLSFLPTGTGNPQNVTNPFTSASGCLGKLGGMNTKLDLSFSGLFLHFTWAVFKFGVPVYTIIAIGA